jgi:hypothetical protein
MQRTWDYYCKGCLRSRSCFKDKKSLGDLRTSSPFINSSITIDECILRTHCFRKYKCLINYVPGPRLNITPGNISLLLASREFNPDRNGIVQNANPPGKELQEVTGTAGNTPRSSSKNPTSNKRFCGSLHVSYKSTKGIPHCLSEDCVHILE